MKMKILKTLVKYLWWFVRMPNNRLRLNGLVMDLAGDLRQITKPVFPR